MTSSSLQGSIADLGQLDELVKSGTEGNMHDRYAASKFIMACGALGWREKLEGKVEVVLVSPGKQSLEPGDRSRWLTPATRPGFVPTSNLSRSSNFLTRMFLYYILSWAPFCTSLKDGQSRLRHPFFATR